MVQRLASHQPFHRAQSAPRPALPAEPRGHRGAPLIASRRLISDLDIIDRLVVCSFVFFFNLKILRLNSLKFILRGYLYFCTFLGIRILSAYSLMPKFPLKIANKIVYL